MAKEAADPVTGLTRVGTKEFGKALIKKAQEISRDSLEKSVVGHIEGILMQIRKQSEYLENCEANLRLLRSKVAAVEAGEFTLSPYGVMTFTDKTLQEGVVAMLECVNCGCNLVKYGHAR